MIRQMESLGKLHINSRTPPRALTSLSSECQEPGREIRLIIYSGCGPTNLALSVALIIQWDESKCQYTRSLRRTSFQFTDWLKEPAEQGWNRDYNLVCGAGKDHEMG